MSTFKNWRHIHVNFSDPCSNLILFLAYFVYDEEEGEEDSGDWEWEYEEEEEENYTDEDDMNFGKETISGNSFWYSGNLIMGSLEFQVILSRLCCGAN